MVTASPSDWKSAAVIGGGGAMAVADLDWERWRSNRSSDCSRDVEINVCRQKGSRASLSDFLNRNLHMSHVLPTSVQGLFVKLDMIYNWVEQIYGCKFFCGLLAPKITRITCIVLLHYTYAVLRDDVVKSVDDYSINELHFSSPMGAEQSERGADRDSVKKEGRHIYIFSFFQQMFRVDGEISHSATDMVVMGLSLNGVTEVVGVAWRFGGGQMVSNYEIYFGSRWFTALAEVDGG
ncbi:hypothetical protein CASFOL_040704 [Castilleja foliolosa]|uniref:Uncharacterized protein n=1 Tax=Castilleja foliolosa TaxID=1961234 RepID=A0ABD3BCD3_9LAMI